MLFVSCEQSDFGQRPFTLKCIQYMVTSVLQDQLYVSGARSLLVHKRVVDKKDLADVLFRRLMQ